MEDDRADATSAVSQDQALRRMLEQSVVALVHSIDGRVFSFRLPLGTDPLKAGDFVRLITDRGLLLGQIVSSEVVLESYGEVQFNPSELSPGFPTNQKIVTRPQLRVLRGEGVLLAAQADDYEPRSLLFAFSDASISPAAVEEIAAYTRGVRTRGGSLAVGSPRVLEEVGESVRLDPKGLRRHTLLCGQSGSGKTYSLGVILEQLLLNTSLRIVVIDPNGDYVGLREAARPEALDEETRNAYTRAVGSIRIFSNNIPAAERLTVRAIDLDPDSIAALLRLDPLADREEYALTTHLLEAARGNVTIREALEQGIDRGESAAVALMQRMVNLGLDKWQVWNPRISCVDALSEDVRCVVLDVGSLDEPEERNLAALAVLRALWSGRHRREPFLIVIDEAHNVSPAVPETRLSARATEEVVRIAGEGRKFGLYLLLATQRPTKLHPNVLSQCENLVLMRMNSRADLDHVATMFSQVPASLLHQASTFTLGEALVAGWVVPHPVFVRFGGRISKEGGADVPPTWAETQSTKR